MVLAQESVQEEKVRDVVLDVRDLRTYLYTRWGVTKAVDGVSFQVHEGETLGIVGESGCGKSMTALSLLRLAPKPAARTVSGEILLDGVDLLKLSETEMRDARGKKISMILQDPQTSLDPLFTVGDQLIETLMAHQKKSESRKTLWGRAVDALRQVRVADPERRMSAYPHEMSGGMKQRVVGATALLSRPRVLIADEPTTALDVTIQAQYLRLLKRVQEEMGVSIIFITHDMGVVAKMCDRAVVMYAGRIVEHGTVRELFHSPTHPYTQALLASVPKMDKKVDRLYSIEGQPPALFDLPEGCRFAPRCQYADDRCRAEYPPTYTSPTGHEVICWRQEDVWPATR
jgi:oligopeptide/dipeptide ABC transporter ATP-binding protein